ncbi:MAG: XRE family transcriptional regulator [Aestuariivirgaceae bacterium]
MAKKAEDVFRKTMTTQARAAAERRGKELVAEYATLQQLRKARQLTQAQLAQTLGKDQVAISQIEKRADMLLSTLRRYVEAMGGQLDLVIQFKDQKPVHLRGFGDDQA